MPAFNSDRIIPATLAVALQLLLGYALIVGLGVAPVPRLAETLKVFDVPPEPVAPPPPKPRPVPPHARAPQPRGAAAPPALRARATPVVAPPPAIKIERPPLIIAAPLPGIGADPSAGAAPVPGPGSGSGGQGNGTGSGSSGTGDGGGGSHAEYLRGDIRDRDYPREARDAGIQGDLTTRYVISPDGRITDCRIVRSSGSALLDSTTCRLVMKRFRYRPARDASGRKVSEVQFDDHHWRLGPPPDEPDDDGPPNDRPPR
ncbi:energy transducer TonB [Glacieibacterium megasporae]|uniref:energy transducer TonB n=1 Tax=Glacieibacterium megasporae TaxID=2835787 RepID=UPI001C1DD0C4|nr:energy transducer TonB [Polymorphobacter megasporae]UAJ09292.1 energy transducer TonB [Polymorphobacter megasporae]